MVIIYCINGKNKDLHFFLRNGREEYYLFTQPYRRGVNSYYAKGVELNKALDHSRGNHDTALIKTMNKLPRYIIYIEKEYGIQVFNKTKRRNELMSCA